MTLREPPKQPQAVNLIGRFLGLIVLLGLFALVVWAMATNQQASAIERSDPRVHAPGEYVTVEQGAMHLLTVGQGSVDVVFIHYDTIAGAASLVPLATGLSDLDRRVILPDLLGYGFSARPGQPGRHLSTTGQAESAAALLDELDGTTYEVMGFGTGGEVATELAVIRPDLTARLVLVDTPELPMASSALHSLEGLPLGLGAAVAYTYDGAAPGAEQRFQDDCPAWAQCTGEVLERYRRAASVPGTADAIRARRASEPAFIAPSRLDQIAVPTLVVAVDVADEEATSLAGRFPDGQAAEVAASELTDALVP